MNIENEIRCRVCNRKMMYLAHEKVALRHIKDGEPIGAGITIPGVNISMHCGFCKVNTAVPFTYKDEKSIEPFIEKVKKASVKFDKLEYINA